MYLKIEGGHDSVIPEFSCVDGIISACCLSIATNY